MKLAQFALLFLLISCSNQAFDLSVIEVLEDSEFNIKSGWIKLENNQRLGSYTRIEDEIFCGEVGCKDHPLKNADATSFHVWPGTEYAKDKEHVYFPESFICMCGNECSACYNSNPVIENGDPNTFTCTDTETAIDKGAKYERSIRIPN